MNNALVPAAKQKTAAAHNGNFFGKENNAAFLGGTRGGSSSFFSPVSAIQRKCQHCQEEEPVQRKENSNAGAPAATAGHYVQNAGGKGVALPQSAQQFFGRSIGHDFSNVKIHTGTEAAQSANAINAQAYTYGNDIVFNEGKYNPATYEGKKLLAHELAHVVQNNGVISPLLKRQADDGTDEPAADAPQADTPQADAPEADAVDADATETPVSISGVGSFTKNTTDFANCQGVRVQGQTTANYSNSFSSSGSRKKGTNCSGCTGDACITSSGTVSSTFSASPAVSLPGVPGGLNPCEVTAVQNFINGTLSAHEQQHVAAFNTYSGTVQTPYSYTGCLDGLDAYIRSIHDGVEVARRGRSDAASAALDANGANVFTITCECPDPQPAPQPDQPNPNP